MGPSVSVRLRVMMFLQYAIWGAWAVSLGGYMNSTLQFTGLQIGSIYSTTAIAAIISPLLMGFLADRLFSTEKLIGTLHLIGAGLLAAAAFSQEFTPLYIIMLIYAMCYMPTLALTNSISFANIDDPEKDFPPIRVWGTWGWIIVGWLVGFVLDVPPGQSHYPVLLAALLSALLGVFSIVALPHTPPQKTDETQEKTGASVIELLSDSSFLIFAICSFLICIPLSFYYAYANVFLAQIDAPYPTALQTIGQLSEVVFMAAMPFFIMRLGIKRMLICGMLAWTLRYLAFGNLSLPLVTFGLILHGICYDFFFVASQIYVDNRADSSQRARAQSFIAFVTMGLGMFVGSYAGGWTVDQYPPGLQVKASMEVETGKTEKQTLTLPNWDIDADPADQTDTRKGLAKLFDLKADSVITAAMIDQDLVLEDSKTTYAKADLKIALAQADANDDGEVSRAEWRVAQRKDWYYIWLWPAIGAAVTCLIFMVGFREEQPADTNASPDPADSSAGNEAVPEEAAEMESSDADSEPHGEN